MFSNRYAVQTAQTERLPSSKSVTVTFAPSSSGTATGTLSFVSNATNSPTTVALSGSGTAAKQHTVTLNWLASGTAETGYNAYRGSASGGPYSRTNGVLNAVPSYMDSSIQSGLTYYHVVTAVDTGGLESGYSTPVLAQIPTP